MLSGKFSYVIGVNHAEELSRIEILQKFYHVKKRCDGWGTRHFGSVRGIKQAGPDALTAVVNGATAAKIRRHFESESAPAEATLTILS